MSATAAPATPPRDPVAAVAPAPSRGSFARLPPDELRRIARLGGQAAAQAGTAHRWTQAEARAAGRLGGAATRARRRR